MAPVSDMCSLPLCDGIGGGKTLGANGRCGWGNLARSGMLAVRGLMSPLDPRFEILGDAIVQCYAPRTIPHRCKRKPDR